MFEVSHYPTAAAQYMLYLSLCHNTFIHNKLESVSKAAYIWDICIPESSDKKLRPLSLRTRYSFSDSCHLSTHCVTILLMCSPVCLSLNGWAWKQPSFHSQLLSIQWSVRLMYESSACEDHKSVVTLTYGTISTNLETHLITLLYISGISVCERYVWEQGVYHGSSILCKQRKPGFSTVYIGTQSTHIISLMVRWSSRARGWSKE